MSTSDLNARTIKVLEERKNEILNSWIAGQIKDPRIDDRGAIRESIMKYSREYIDALVKAITAAGIEDVDASEFDDVKNLLAVVSNQRDPSKLTPPS